jgi:hypothetical protein
MIDFWEAQIADAPNNCKAALEKARLAVEISSAGAALRGLQSSTPKRQERAWTGKIGKKRGWVGMAVVLPGRTLGTLLASKRGWACVAHVDPFSVRSRRIGYVEARSLEPFRHPAAVALGARKKGVAERRSARKAETARRNGRCPVRPGSRPRGRPRANPVMAAAPSDGRASLPGPNMGDVPMLALSTAGSSHHRQLSASQAQP